MFGKKAEKTTLMFRKGLIGFNVTKFPFSTSEEAEPSLLNLQRKGKGIGP